MFLWGNFNDIDLACDGKLKHDVCDRMLTGKGIPGRTPSHFIFLFRHSSQAVATLRAFEDSLLFSLPSILTVLVSAGELLGGVMISDQTNNCKHYDCGQNKDLSSGRLVTYKETLPVT
jgi:hypothetical protein